MPRCPSLPMFPEGDPIFKKGRRPVLQDARYHNMNATKWCYATFVDYKKCRRLLGADDCCKQFEQIFKSICPNAWVEKWEKQIEDGTFPVDLPPEKK